jgi:hypothetical protein
MKFETHRTEIINNKYVYRYLTIEKLIDFFETNSIYLTRLDLFEDNLENIDPFDINELKLLTLTKPPNANPLIEETKWEEIINLDKKRLIEIQSDLIENQKKRFASCWILSDVESFGMWDTYGKEGFVIRFNREYFEKIIKESISIQIEPTSKIELLVVGKVIYQDFEKIIKNEKESRLQYSAFRKHLSFQHESEFRIVGFANNLENQKGLMFKLPDINNLDFEIFANPRFTDFQFQKYNKIIEKYSIEKDLKISELKNFLDFRNLKY